jgi:hypothetical protein
LREWNEAAKVFCAPTKTTTTTPTPSDGDSDVNSNDDGDGDGDSNGDFDVARKKTTLRCRAVTLRHMPLPTAPHTLCDASNLIVDFSKFSKALCPKHRPGTCT